jgi:hypothetical protein
MRSLRLGCSGQHQKGLQEKDKAKAAKSQTKAHICELSAKWPGFNARPNATHLARAGVLKSFGTSAANLCPKSLARPPLCV